MEYSSPEFVLAFFAIVVGIPVVCGTLVKIIHGPKELRRGKNRQSNQRSEKDQETLQEIFHGLQDLGKRIQNIETITSEDKRRD